MKRKSDLDSNTEDPHELGGETQDEPGSFGNADAADGGSEEHALEGGAVPGTADEFPDGHEDTEHVVSVEYFFTRNDLCGEVPRDGRT